MSFLGVSINVHLPQISKIFLNNPSGSSFADSSIIWPSRYSWIFLRRFSLAAGSCPCPEGTLEDIFLLIIWSTSRYFSTWRSTCCSSSFFSGFVALKKINIYIFIAFSFQHFIVSTNSKLWLSLFNQRTSHHIQFTLRMNYKLIILIAVYIVQ